MLLLQRFQTKDMLKTSDKKTPAFRFNNDTGRCFSLVHNPFIFHKHDSTNDKEDNHTSDIAAEC